MEKLTKTQNQQAHKICRRVNKKVNPNVMTLRKDENGRIRLIIYVDRIDFETPREMKVRQIVQKMGRTIIYLKYQGVLYYIHFCRRPEGKEPGEIPAENHKRKKIQTPKQN